MPVTRSFSTDPTFQWLIRLDHGSRSLDSPKFFFSGVHWHLNFEVLDFQRDANLLRWNIRLKPENLPERLMYIFAMLQVPTGDGDVRILAQRTITVQNFGDNNYISLTQVPGFEYYFNERRELTLIVSLKHYDQPGPEIDQLEREHKSVQTPLYLDERPCLEKLSFDLRKLADADLQPDDIQLRCGGQILVMNRHILGARSEVFKAMLQSDMSESNRGFIEIVDMEYAILDVFVRYLYAGILPELNVAIASGLYEAGDKYQVGGLTERCRAFLEENLTQENACELLAMADAHSDKKFKDFVMSYVLEKEIPIKYEGWFKFKEDRPMLAYEVLYQAYRLSKGNIPVM